MCGDVVPTMYLILACSARKFSDCISKVETGADELFTVLGRCSNICFGEKRLQTSICNSSENCKSAISRPSQTQESQPTRQEHGMISD